MSGNITVVNEAVRAVLALQRENLILRGDLAALEATIKLQRARIAELQAVIQTCSFCPAKLRDAEVVG